MCLEQEVHVLINIDGTVSGVISLSLDDIPSPARMFELGWRAQVLADLVAYTSLQPAVGGAARLWHWKPLARAFRAIRRELGLSQAEVACRAGTSEICVSRWETGTQPANFGPLHRWCEAIGVVQDGPGAIVVSVDVAPEIVRELNRTPELLHQLSPDAFESFVAERLDRMGFDVQRTGSVTLRDGGIDMIAVPKQRCVATYLMAVQVKHHAATLKTGRAPVDRLLSWKDAPFSFGLLATNTGFTRDALWLASLDRNRGFLRLRDFEDLKRWIAGQFWSREEWREIPSSIPLAPGVEVSIPMARIHHRRGVWPEQEYPPRPAPGIGEEK